MSMQTYIDTYKFMRIHNHVHQYMHIHTQSIPLLTHTYIY